MHEKLVIVPRRLSGKRKMVTSVFFVLACVCLSLATFISPGLFMVPAVLFIIFWVWMGFFSNVEYEYTYYDGDLHLAKITNKAKRKNLAAINMEDVIAIAPKGDRSVYKYENDRGIKVKNLTSGRDGAKIYELIFKGDKGILRYEIEPDEEMLDAMRVKYSRIVMK